MPAAAQSAELDSPAAEPPIENAQQVRLPFCLCLLPVLSFLARSIFACQPAMYSRYDVAAYDLILSRHNKVCELESMSHAYISVVCIFRSLPCLARMSMVGIVRVRAKQVSWFAGR